jgi:hypothetical protein
MVPAVRPTPGAKPGCAATLRFGTVESPREARGWNGRLPLKLVDATVNICRIIRPLAGVPFADHVNVHVVPDLIAEVAATMLDGLGAAAIGWQPNWSWRRFSGSGLLDCRPSWTRWIGRM